MLLTPITDSARITNVKVPQKLVIKQVELSKKVIAWLCKTETGRVHVVGLAVDFYLASFMRDILMKRISGEDGFDPLTGYDHYIANDVSFTAWIGSLQLSMLKSIDWQDSFMFTYLCAAVAGELRHVSTSDHAIKEKLASFNILNADTLTVDSVRSEVQRKFLKDISIERIREFLVLAVDCFRNCKWSSGYGGPKWGEIANTGLNRFDMLISQSEFVDRVYDLKHNGGPMFDKNKAVDNSYLQEFLDAKFLAKSDVDWYKWLKYTSADMRSFIEKSCELKLWSGGKPTGTPFSSVSDGYGNNKSSVDSNDDDDSNESDESEDSEKIETPTSTSYNEKQQVSCENLNKYMSSCESGHAMILDAFLLPDKA